jgi:hypothetical protein
MDCKEFDCMRDSCRGCQYDDSITAEDMTLEWAQHEEANIPKFNRKGERVA